MSSHKNLHFFNKSGDSLNLNYNENTQLFEGSLLFDENSTDTFKTYALYTLEKVVESVALFRNSKKSNPRLLAILLFWYMYTRYSHLFLTHFINPIIQPF